LMLIEGIFPSKVKLDKERHLPSYFHENKKKMAISLDSRETILT
jgi:hypothetical protein